MKIQKLKLFLPLSNGYSKLLVKDKLSFPFLVENKDNFGYGVNGPYFAEINFLLEKEEYGVFIKLVFKLFRKMTERTLEFSIKGSNMMLSKSNGKREII